MKYALYRCFDADGVLLYVGCSMTLMARVRTHNQHTTWFNRVHVITLTWFNNNADVHRAEALAITIERPSENKQHNKKAPLDDLLGD
jgi:predicted GIY-YIG superfamily endonuclease